MVVGIADRLINENIRQTHHAACRPIAQAAGVGRLQVTAVAVARWKPRIGRDHIDGHWTGRLNVVSLRRDIPCGLRTGGTRSSAIVCPGITQLHNCRWRQAPTCVAGLRKGIIAWDAAARSCRPCCSTGHGGRKLYPIDNLSRLRIHQQFTIALIAGVGSKIDHHAYRFTARAANGPRGFAHLVNRKIAAMRPFFRPVRRSITTNY